MSKLIVITGVTGAQGSSIAKTFLTLPGWRVRGITRNPSSATSLALSSLGVEIVKGDLDDKSSLIPAFKDAHTIFANPDFLNHFFSAIADPALASSHDGNAKRYAHDREVQHGLNIAEVAASPAVLATLQLFIYSSLQHASEASKGKYTEVYHFDCKAAVLKVIREKYPELASKMSLLQMGHYGENWRVLKALAPRKESGSGKWLMTRPTSAECVYDFVVAEKDTGEFVRALVELPPGTNLMGVSESMTAPEYAAVWGKVHGVEVGFEQVSYDEFFDGFPKVVQEELGDSFKFLEEFGRCGALTAAELGVQLKLTSMEEFIRGEDWSSVVKV
ncbi:hypothetical protein VTL71DRAFT_9916 [Oculimacula yallundae]|uniref:NmrA-like domain-containing protein n=1 Tax=Oculimacula yallundae TaxID=86028 RepID=A0ABR4BSR7_9HELO